MLHRFGYYSRRGRCRREQTSQKVSENEEKSENGETKTKKNRSNRPRLQLNCPRMNELCQNNDRGALVFEILSVAAVTSSRRMSSFPLYDSTTLTSSAMDNASIQGVVHAVELVVLAVLPSPRE